MPSPIRTPIRLDQFLKLQTRAGSGGTAKVLIQSGSVLVNGEVELRRRRQLHAGDRIDVEGEKFLIPGERSAPPATPAPREG